MDWILAGSTGSFCSSSGVNMVGPPSLGSVYSDTNQALSPSFPTADTPDFLNSLSQMNDSLLFPDGGRTPQGGGSLPRTPQQQSNTPFNHTYIGQGNNFNNPSTPSAMADYQPNTPLTDNFHPGTPTEGQQCSTTCTSDKTQQNMSSSPSSSSSSLLVGVPTFNSSNQSQQCNNSSHSSTVKDHVFPDKNNSSATITPTSTANSMNNQPNTPMNNSIQDSHESMKTPELKVEFTAEIGFHTSSLIDSNDQEDLDVGFTVVLWQIFLSNYFYWLLNFE